jgi:hypothetical protein
MAESRVRHVYFDLAEAIVDRTLERGQLLILEGPSYRTRHLPDLALDTSKNRPEFPEPTGQNFRNAQHYVCCSLLPV